MKRSGAWALVCVTVLALVLAGCDDWETTDSADSWDNSFAGLNVTGLYASDANGVVVRQAQTVYGPDSQTILGEIAATGDGGRTVFSGVLSRRPVISGSISLTGDGFAVIDDGAGRLMTIADVTANSEQDTVATGDGSSAYWGTLNHTPVVPGSLQVSAGVFTLVDDGSGGLVPGQTEAGETHEETVPNDGFTKAYSGSTVFFPVTESTLSIRRGTVTVADPDGDGVLVGGGATGVVVYATGEWAVDFGTTAPIGIAPNVVINYMTDAAQQSGTIVYETGAWSINLAGDVLALGTPIIATYQVADQAQAGSIVYGTGAWSLNLGDAVGYGRPIYANYTYSVIGSSENQTPGNSNGQAIYSFTVFQQGDLLRITDNLGNVYMGRINDPLQEFDTGVPVVSTDTGAIPGTDPNADPNAAAPAGTDSLTQNIGASYPFSVTGKIGGVQVEIVGTFKVTVLINYAVTADQDGGTTLTEVFRRNSFFMQGTWMENGAGVAAIEAAGPSDLDSTVIQ